MLYKEFLKSLVGQKGLLHSRREGTSILYFVLQAHHDMNIR